jgi:hypothetical protein
LQGADLTAQLWCVHCFKHPKIEHTIRVHAKGQGTFVAQAAVALFAHEVRRGSHATGLSLQQNAGKSFENNFV